MVAHIGVLALQGAFAKHLEMIKSLGAKATPIRFSKQLEECDALIIPGGESTTILRQMDHFDLRDPHTRICSQKAPVRHLRRHDHYGPRRGGPHRKALGVSGHYRRAQRLRAAGQFVHRTSHGTIKDPPHLLLQFYSRSYHSLPWAKVKVLASHNGAPVLVQEGRHLCCSFHPELTSDPSIHRYFLSLI